jgi:hypothetical protein
MDDQRLPPAAEPAPPALEPGRPGAAAPAVAAAPVTTSAEPTVEPSPPASVPARRSTGAVVTIWLLAVALVLVLAAGAWLAGQFVKAQQQISDQEDRISEQDDEIEQQKELIDEKETFGAAMNGLLGTAAQFDGVLTASIVPWDRYQTLVDQAWAHRWNADELSRDTEQVGVAASQLEEVWAKAQQEASTNVTGSNYESVIDRLGAGLVRSVLDEKSCGIDDDSILGCVFSNQPYVVHFDASGDVEPYMTDELRTGIAYHEFAHVLQFANPEALDAELPAFDGDYEVMADCFALTFLDGWKLDHRIWISSYEYWDVSIGYGKVCSESQQQAVRDWYAGLPATSRQLQAETSS